MKQVSLKIQRTVRIVLFALVATGSLSAALAMKPAETPPNTYKYGVTDNNDDHWRVLADVTAPSSSYDCTPGAPACTVEYMSDAPLAPNALIPKESSTVIEPGVFSIP
jgi:hypothetical protein